MKPKKGKTGGKRSSSVKLSFDTKGKWKPVELDPHLFAEEGMNDLVCFEELTSYRLVDNEKAVKQLRKENNRAKKREAEQAGDEPVKKKKKKKRQKVAENDAERAGCGTDEEVKQEGESSSQEDGESQKETAAVSEHVQSSNTEKKKKKKQKKKKSTQQTEQTAVKENQEAIKPPEVEKPHLDQRKPPKKQPKNWTNAALSGSEEKNSDVSAWKDLFVPSAVLKALSSLGFTSPTPIQALALPPAIRDRMDILGAAETGKTDLIGDL
uniref:RNA helicase n=1 Tax=Xiphophorus maculatus TaxID=8083 RepID=A0A3B5PY28_XIPMA